MAECELCGQSPANYCNSCEITLCNEHIKLHEIKEHQKVKNCGIRWSCSGVIEDLIAKISITYDCERENF